MTRGLLQLSGIVIDLTMPIERMPRSGEQVWASAAALAPGGGFNAIAAARRQGAYVAYGGALGVGPLAEVARAALDAEKVEALQTRPAEGEQGLCVTLAELGGERSFVVHPGAERKAGIDAYAALPTSQFAWALIGGYAAPEPPEPDPYGDWLSKLPHPTRLMFDPTPLALSVSPNRLAAALGRADWVSANAREAAALTGADDPAGAAALLARDREGAIVRDGARGCWLSLAGAPARRTEGFAVDAIDPTGAGDAHIGAFIAAMLGGASPFEAARHANATAAISVTRWGPATAPTRAETIAFLAKRGRA